jgi:uncharacterized integral membrane protein
MKRKKQPATKGKTKKENKSFRSKIIRYVFLILLGLFLLALFLLIFLMQNINLKHK